LVILLPQWFFSLKSLSSQYLLLPDISSRHLPPIYLLFARMLPS
jgi:hypothetical protein